MLKHIQTDIRKTIPCRPMIKAVLGLAWLKNQSNKVWVVTFKKLNKIRMVVVFFIAIFELIRAGRPFMNVCNIYISLRQTTLVIYNNRSSAGGIRGQEVRCVPQLFSVAGTIISRVSPHLLHFTVCTLIFHTSFTRDPSTYWASTIEQALCC